MKFFSGCLMAIVIPVGLIWFSFFLRGLWIDHRVQPRETLPQLYLDNAQTNPDIFEKNLKSAFNFLAGDNDYITQDKRVPYRFRNWEHSNYDLDSDGFTSLLEMEKVRRRRGKEKELYDPSRSTRGATVLMAFDSNNDNKVTRKELVDGIDKAIFEGCPFPEITSDDMLIYLLTEQGGRSSAITVSGQDEVTKVANVIISDDAPDLYIIADAEDPVIWQISGNIDRVKRFVAKGGSSTNREIRALNYPNVGVFGLPNSRVSFLGKRCINNNWQTRQRVEKLEQAKSRIEKRIGRSPDKIITERLIHGMKLPEGYGVETRSKDKKVRSEAWKTVKANWDISVFNAELNEVLSPGTISKYEVLPGREGVNQLVKSGHLKDLNCGNYWVEKQLPRFPAGMSGSEAVNFQFPLSMPLPQGKKGQSKVERLKKPNGVSCIYIGKGR